ncbi:MULTISPECIES: hypothetical protein [unclassified Streptomyces]|uniref:hypothetical protein n=1 Tax=unclassified Streptomyces TaxID=2593676 RepID=UPI003663507C
MADDQAAPEAVDLGAIQGSSEGAAVGIPEIPAQIQVQESPTVAVARERLVEAIGREAVFLADQRAGQAFEGLEALARAFALATGGAAHVPAASVTGTPTLSGRGLGDPVAYAKDFIAGGVSSAQYHGRASAPVRVGAGSEVEMKEK